MKNAMNSDKISDGKSDKKEGRDGARASSGKSRDDCNSEIQQFLVFKVGEHYFGFKTSDLEAVTRVLEITPLSRTANFVEGLLSLRGRLTPVINLAKMLQLGGGEISTESRLLAIKASSESNLCILVESVIGFDEVKVTELQSPPDVLFNQYIHSVYRGTRHMVLVLDSKKLVDPEEIRMLVDAQKPTLTEITSRYSSQ